MNPALLARHGMIGTRRISQHMLIVASREGEVNQFSSLRIRRAVCDVPVLSLILQWVERVEAPESIETDSFFYGLGR